jgi:protein TonB
MAIASSLRLTVGIPVAALVTLGLFAGMNALITVDEVSLAAKERVTLARIVPQFDSLDIRTLSRSQPTRVASADVPPPLPKFAASKSDVNLPTPSIEGAAPTEIRPERLQSMVISTPAIPSRVLMAVRAPAPVYPSAAETRRIEGTCEVNFSVDVRGKPYDITPKCSDPVFDTEAKRAVARAEFAPEVRNGQAVERRNVVYPLVFQLDN